MKFKIFLGIALAAGCMVSCSVEDNDSEASKVKEDYTREFIKKFGTIAPNQDWSVIEQKSVTVDLPKPSHVQIFEMQGGVYRLAADYNDVTKQTITFDGLEGDNTPFIVNIDGASYAADNGQTLTIGAASKKCQTRASVIPDDCTYITRGTPQTITLHSTDLVLNVLAQHKIDPVEMGTVTIMLPGTRWVLTKGSQGVFYPVYSNSTKKHIVGIFYYSNGKLVRVPLYTDKTSSDDLSFFASNSDNTAYPVETDADDCWQYTHTPTTESPDGKWKVSFEKPFKFQSSPYYITAATQNIAAGAYVQIGDNIYYSDPSMNEGGKQYFASKAISHSDGRFSGYCYVCFDDPGDNGAEGDGDFNDFIFLTPVKISPVSSETLQWTVACEDLGGLFDYDFNDIVFRVSHASGQSYLTIYPLAAGGTYPAYLCYKNQPISKEWHQHFGNGYDSNVMINTGRVTEHDVYRIRLKGIPTNWSMNSFTADPTAKDGDFSILVERGGGQQTVTGPSKGSAPQMLILPADWLWPTELTPITTAYPNFGTWGANYTNSTWVEKVEENAVVPSLSVTSSKGILEYYVE